MDIQMAPVQGQAEDEHHDKTSVLKKVKDKAKRIKDTLGIKIHGQGHNQDHEEEDDDKELEEDPIYESTSPRSMATGQTDQSRINLGQTREPFDEDPHAPKDPTQAISPANYQTKVTDPTNAGGEDVGISPIISSFEKMVVLDEPSDGQKSSVTGSHDQFSPDLSSTETKTIPENTQSVPETYNVDESGERAQDKSAGEATKQQRSYTEKISSATSSIADKAISTKNIVTSKLGYGGNNDGEKSETNKEGEHAKSTGVSEYGRQIASTVAEKLEPVYEKVTEAGNAAVSEVQGTGTGTGTETEGGVKRPDKGISVMKKYLLEKLKPGDEDKALSEVISEALLKRKDEESKSMGKVTESPEVAKRLGTNSSTTEGSEKSEGTGTGIGRPAGKGIVSGIRGTVCSWLGKGGESPTSQPSHVGEQGGGVEIGHGHAGERKLQESTN